MEFRGESFFCYGLIDFMLFLILAWRKWLLRVSQIFFSSSSPGVLGFWFWLLRTLPNNWLFLFFSPTGRRCHFRFRVSANHLASLSFPLVSSDLRLLSTIICWYPLCDLHSFLTVTLWRLASSIQREDSINLISIVSVGYHVTLLIHFVKSPSHQKIKHFCICCQACFGSVTCMPCHCSTDSCMVCFTHNFCVLYVSLMATPLWSFWSSEVIL